MSASMNAANRSSTRPAADIAPVGSLEAITGSPAEAHTILDAFEWHLARHPQREHVTLIETDDSTTTVTYAHMWAAAIRAACGLQGHGIRHGDTVAIMLPTCLEFFEVCLGAMLLGAIAVPIYPPLRWSELEEHVQGRAAVLANCSASVLVTVPEARLVGRALQALVPGLRHVVCPNALHDSNVGLRAAALRTSAVAMLQYTSGSTGDPKGVVLTHAMLLANIRAMREASGAHSRDRFLSWLPLYHDMGLIGAWMGTLYTGIPLNLMSPTIFLARPSRWLRAIDRFGATLSAGPNFAYDLVSSRVRDADFQGLDLSSWRLAFNGAEPVRAATMRRFAQRFAPYGFRPEALTPVYGLAESAVGLAFPSLSRSFIVDSIDREALARDGVAVPDTSPSSATLEIVACGRALPAHDIRVVAADGRVVADRTEGRIQFKGPSATTGYFRNAPATAALRNGDWLETGDTGYMVDGELFPTSRTKDIVKRGGHSIHPQDVEAVVEGIEGIRKGCVAVFGSPDPGSGTERLVVVAECRARHADDVASLRAALMSTVAMHLNGPPNEVFLVPPRTIPKTSSGKLRRSACRALYESGQLGVPRAPVWRQVAGLAARTIGTETARRWRTLRGR